MKAKQHHQSRKRCSGRGCRRKACVGCHSFQQIVEDVKIQLTQKGPSVEKREHLTELLKVTTGMSVAVLFPYISLK